MRVDLPSGTVTFVFTDIEGSTRLLDEIGPAAYAEALADHRRVAREACTAFAGVEVDTQGDAFFLAFGRAADGLDAAQQITERLGDGQIRLRIGVHTGSPLLTDEGYVGADVHRAARIAAAGHGGQVLVSASRPSATTSRTALDLGMRTAPALALEMAPMLTLYWVHAGTLREGQERIATALAGVPEAPATARAAALYGAALLAHHAWRPAPRISLGARSPRRQDRSRLPGVGRLSGRLDLHDQ